MKMASTKYSSQDKKDFEKFTKYLVYKCIQIIVQSRLGERLKTQSRPFSTGADWFNLAIKDLPEVLTECKKVVSTGSVSMGHNVCLEISLKTTEGESMILETWWLTIIDQSDPTAKISYSVYNRMGVLLKSLFCATRATPAYKLSRKQGPDTYVVCYRIYNSDPQMTCLGEDYRISKVGSVPSPFGTVTLSVGYRTKMLISPHSSLKDFAADLKDDHFKSESSPKKSIDIPKPCYMVNKDNRPHTTEEGYTFGESEYCATSFSTSPPTDGFYLGQSPPGKGIYHRTSSENLIKKVSADQTPYKVFSDTTVKPSSGQNIMKGQTPYTNGLNGIHSIVQEEMQSEDPGDDKNQDSADFKQIGAFVSDGESDSGDDDIDHGTRNVSNMCTNNHEHHNTDSVELPFVKMVREMSSIDATNLNSAPSSFNHIATPATDSKTAVIKITDISNGDSPHNKSALSSKYFKLQSNNVKDTTNCEFIEQKNSDYMNIDTTSPTTKPHCGKNDIRLSPSRKNKGNLSELSQRLKNVSGGEASKGSGSSISDGGVSGGQVSSQNEVEVQGHHTDEYVMVDVKNALTEMDDNPELGQFYRECKLPPDLAMFSENSHQETENPTAHQQDATTMQDMFNSITDQLQMFEMQAQDFDEFVNSLSVGESA